MKRSLAVTYETNMTATIAGQFEATALPENIDLEAGGNISDIAGTPVSQFKPLIEQGLKWAIGSTFNRENFSVLLHNFSLENRQIKVSGKGEIAGEVYPLSSTLTVSLTDIANAVPEASGPVEVSVTLQQDIAEGRHS